MSRLFQRSRQMLGFIFVVLAATASAFAQDTIPQAGAAEIRALLQEKAGRTPAQRKLDSQILYQARLAAGQPAAVGVGGRFRASNLERSAEGLIHVDIDGDVNNALLLAIRTLGGRVEVSLAQYRSVRAWLPLAAAETLAGRTDVRFIKPAARGITNAAPKPVSVREANVRAQLRRALPAFVPGEAATGGGSGFNVSTVAGPDVNGVKAHGANLVQAAGIMGAGVKIGVMSNGVTSLATEQAANRLPAGITVLAGQSGNGAGPCPGSNCPDEGTAMLEIVYSMAPGAQLYYATGTSGEAQFAANIIALKAAGCSIIVDDITYQDEPVFQDGTVAKAVNTVTTAGALYFSSAANSGNLDSGQSGTWEGDFNANGAAPAITEVGTVHSFGATNYDTLTSKGNYYAIQWSDPFGGACDDYDLFILNPAGTSVEGASTNTQSCSQNPIEFVDDSSSILVNSRIVIVRVSGAARALHLDTGRGRLSIGTTGNTFGHNAVGSGFSVAAVNVATAGGGIFTGGTANPPESFSSDGPRKIFFNAAGNPITAGNFLFATNGGLTLNKVDFTATDGVTTGVPGFISFFGTSAAAPHAAAIAALIKSAAPSLTAAQVKNTLYTTSLNVSNFLPQTVGSGIVMANLAVAAVLAPPVISKTFGAGSVPLGGGTSLSFSVTNPAANSVALSGIAFTDTLPAGLAVSTPNGLSGGCGGGVITATAGSGVVSLTGATLASGVSCTFSVNVTALAAGTKTNSVTVSTPIGNGNTATAVLLVIAPPTISKTFVPSKIRPGNISAVTFLIANPNSFAGLTGVGFNDALPAGLVVAAPNGLTSTCAGTATAGSGAITLSGVALAASASCTLAVNVTAPENIYLNSVTVTSTNGGTGNTSSATLFVATPPNLSKVFGAVSIGVNNTTSLTFTLANPNHIVTLNALQFSDALPAGLVIANPNGLTGTCGGGTITALSGGNLVTLGGAALAPQASCTFGVNVTSNGAALGLLLNSTSTVTSTEAGPGDAALANIFVGDPFQISYAANLSVGDSAINITNAGTLGASLASGTTASVVGALCANVYAFTPDEQLVSCCSCPVTPNGLVSFSAKNDLASNTLTPAVPTALVVKVLATVPVAGSCNNSAATVGTASLANGMKSFGTTIHATPTAGSYGVTETPFSAGTLSTGELVRIGNLCNFILANGSGFGVCRTCRLGGLGAVQQ